MGQVLVGAQHVAVEEVTVSTGLIRETDHLTVMYQRVRQIVQKIYFGYH